MSASALEVLRFWLTPSLEASAMFCCLTQPFINHIWSCFNPSACIFWTRNLLFGCLRHWSIYAFFLWYFLDSCESSSKRIHEGMNLLYQKLSEDSFWNINQVVFLRNKWKKSSVFLPPKKIMKIVMLMETFGLAKLLCMVYSFMYKLIVCLWIVTQFE